MSDMDGLDLIAKVRKQFDEKELPAIALTAFASLEDRDKAISAGFQIHYPKPVDIDELPNIIENLLQK